MWILTACKMSVSLSFFNWIKNKMIFLSYMYLWNNVGNINSEVRYKSFHFDLVQEVETNWNFKGYQMPHFMIV